MDARQRGGGDQAVDSLPAAEAHVVDAADKVEAGGGSSCDRAASPLVECLDRRDADANVAQELSSLQLTVQLAGWTEAALPATTGFRSIYLLLRPSTETRLNGL